MEYKFIDDRDCEHCKHKINGLCEKWECEFEPREETDGHS